MAETILIASGKGGVGKSTATLFFGRAMAKQGKKVLLIDADTGLGALDILLGVADKTMNTWLDVEREVCRLENAFIPISDNLTLLPSPKEYDETLPDDVFRLLKFGKFQSGTVRNALSAHTHMEGSLRAFQEEIFDGLARGLADIGEAVETEFGCTVKLHFSDGYPAVMNPPELFDRVRACVPFRELESPSMTAEDFSWYQKTLPGLFFFLGLGDVPALHTDTFDFDETILLKGADFFEKLAENLT